MRIENVGVPPASATVSGIVNLTAQVLGAGAKTFTDQAVIGKAITSGVVTLTDGSTPALDASLGNTFNLTTTTAPTIAVPSNPVNGQCIIINFTASGAQRTLTLNTNTGGFVFGTDITALTPTTNGKTDAIGCKYDVTQNRWRVLAYTKGF